MSNQHKDIMSQDELGAYTKECIQSWVQEEIELNEDYDSGSINERVCTTIDTYLESLHTRLSFASYAFNRPTALSVRSVELDKEYLELAIFDAIKAVVINNTKRKGIFTVPINQLTTDIIKFIKENADEINKIK